MRKALMKWFDKRQKVRLTASELDAFLQQERVVSDARKGLQMLIAAHAIFKEQIREKYKMPNEFLIDTKTGEIIEGK